MKKGNLVYFVIFGSLCCLLFASAGVTVPRDKSPQFDDSTEGEITYKQRLRAQKSIERVLYEQRIWPENNPPRPPFEKAVPDEIIEQKVQSYLKKSIILEQFWKRPITGEQLQAELDRMMQQTKKPQQLRELFAALNNDPQLIAECFVRPILVDRLIHNWFVSDDRIHAAVLKKCEQIQKEITRETFFDYPREKYVTTFLVIRNQVNQDKGDNVQIAFPSGFHLPKAYECDKEEFIALSKSFPGPGEPISCDERADSFIFPMTHYRENGILVASSLIIEKELFESWFERKSEKITGGTILSFQPPEYSYSFNKALIGTGEPDTWSIEAFIPPGRQNHTAIWTGSEMIIWGGSVSGTETLQSGGRYSPATDTWSKVSKAYEPEVRANHTAVWTGSDMIIWGGYRTLLGGELNSGARYNPVHDSWTTLTSDDAPVARSHHSAIWTGEEMIVWGGYTDVWNQTNTKTGGRYNLSSNSWNATDDSATINARSSHSAVWTGTEMIIWGGNQSVIMGQDPDDKAWLYSPTNDTWSPSTTTNAPVNRAEHTAVWTGSNMIIWGGYDDPTYFDTGRMYNPSIDTWTTLSTAGSPSARGRHKAVWTGNKMIIWGGYYDTAALDDGNIYNPANDGWSAVNSANAPTARSLHTAVWTGTEMIIWGGLTTENTGGRYNPGTDSWIDTSFTQTPYYPFFAQGIWTGYEIVLWGGSRETSFGKRYIPATDTWLNINSSGQPTDRYSHTAVWTGSDMIIWGGEDSVGLQNDGAQYNVIGNIWTSLGSTGTIPVVRKKHTALWTGTHMIVWGGENITVELKSGGLYDPSPGTGVDYWAATDTVDAPDGRVDHTAIWTGTEMIVWGGHDGTDDMDTGGRYNPVSDSWLDTQQANAPHPRKNHTAIWTGTEMLIFGGSDNTIANKDGALYDPGTDDGFQNPWTLFDANLVTNIVPLTSHTALWTQREMIMWGGTDVDFITGQSQDTGARYTIPTDSWVVTPEENAPGGRRDHLAFWTGDSMLVWGGIPNATLGIFYPNRPPVAHVSAMYDEVLHVPMCGSLGGICDSGNLLLGRGAMSGGAEPHEPNTLDSCDDGDSGVYLFDESIERITVYTLDGSAFQATKKVGIDVVIYAFTDYTENRLDLYYAADATNPGWIYITSITPTVVGEQTLTATYSLPVGDLQAVRAQLVYKGIASPCTTGNFNDRDDLVFSVGTETRYPQFSLGAGYTLDLSASGSGDGDNPYNTTHFHDAGDSLVSHEWDIDGNAGFLTDCDDGLSVGIEYDQEDVVLDDATLSALGIYSPGDHEFSVRVTDSTGLKSCSHAKVTMIDGVPPVVNVVDPDGGEAWNYSPNEAERREHRIVWESSDNFEVTRTRLSYSADNGSTWSYIADSDNLNYMNGNQGVIPDNNPTGIYRTITTPDSGTVSEVNVRVNILHGNVGDLTISLTSPDDTTIVLCDREGGSGTNFSYVYFDDDALQSIVGASPPLSGNYQPEAALATFNGENSGGDWKLTVADNETGNTGILMGWSINFSQIHNQNDNNTETLCGNSQSFLWQLPTAEEAAAGSQTLPSYISLLKVEVWDASDQDAADESEENFYLVKPSTGNVKTLIIWHSERMELLYDETRKDALYEGLTALADHTTVNGVVVDLKNAGISFSGWDGISNSIANSIKTYIDSLINNTYNNVEYLIFVGDDRQVPFYRMNEGVAITPESDYSGAGSGSVGLALAADKFLTDNYYSEVNPVDSDLASNDKVYENDFAIGRLVETPEQIIQLINAYLSNNGEVEITSGNDQILVTGYDFAYDAGIAVKGKFDTAGKTTDCLMDDPDNNSVTLVCSDPLPDFDDFTATHLQNKLFDPNTIIMNINCHANHFELANSASGSSLTTTILDGLTAKLSGRIIFTTGCHSGLPVADGANTLDLPEEMAKKEVLGYIANTGYGWGMDVGVGLSEELMRRLAHELLKGPSVTLGKALAEAKMQYYLATPRYDVFDEKVMHELTLFGIPNTIIRSTAEKKAEATLPLPDGPDTGCAGDICLTKKLIRNTKDDDLPDGMTQLNLDFIFNAYEKIDAGDKGQYYKLNNDYDADVGQPLQPRLVYDSTLAETTVHGVLFISGDYDTHDNVTGEPPAFNPVVGVPSAQDYQDKTEGNFPVKRAYSPEIHVSYGQGSAVKASGDSGYSKLSMQTGYYLNNEELLYKNLQFTTYYSTITGDNDGPDITESGTGYHTLNGFTATFSVTVTDTTSEVYRVLITYNDLVQKQWRTLELSHADHDNWEGELVLNGNIDYFVQAVDSIGNVSFISESKDDKNWNGEDFGSTLVIPVIHQIIFTDSEPDGLPDAWEDLYPCVTSGTVDDMNADFDLDNLSHFEEMILKTNPCIGDTDEGGENDGSEAAHGRDPLEYDDDKHITLNVTQGTGTVVLQWHDYIANSDNAEIDGYYFVYRSDTPFFDPADLLNPAGIQHCSGRPECTNDGGGDDHEYTDSTCGPGICYYKVWNNQLQNLPPIVTEISPHSAAAGMTLQIFGEHFQDGATVKICGTDADDVVFENPSLITCTIPSGSGTGNVEVINPNGQNGTLTGAFTYL